MYENALTEILEYKEDTEIVAIKIFRKICCKDKKLLINKMYPTNEDLEVLNFKYDAGYGFVEVEGLVLFNDGSWLERCEYDGAEWWELKKQVTLKDVQGYEVRILR